MPVFTANIPGILKIGDRIEIGGRIKENARKYVLTPYLIIYCAYFITILYFKQLIF